MRCIELMLPLQRPLPSTANLREHWTAKARRVANQRSMTRIALTLHRPALLGLDFPACGLPMTATLTRVATRRLDDDNLASAFKAVRDEVAAFFRLDDGSQLWRWRYEQAKGAPAIQFRFEVAEGVGHYTSGEQATGEVDALTERVRQLEAELAQARK